MRQIACHCPKIQALTLTGFPIPPSAASYTSNLPVLPNYAAWPIMARAGRNEIWEVLADKKGSMDRLSGLLSSDEQSMPRYASTRSCWEPSVCRVCRSHTCWCEDAQTGERRQKEARPGNVLAGTALLNVSSPPSGRTFTRGTTRLRLASFSSHVNGRLFSNKQRGKRGVIAANLCLSASLRCSMHPCLLLQYMGEMPAELFRQGCALGCWCYCYHRGQLAGFERLEGACVLKLYKDFTHVCLHN